MRALLLALAVAAGAVFVISASDRNPRHLSAERFVLLDAKGHERAVLEVTDSGAGTAQLRLINANGRSVAILEDGTDTTGLRGTQEPRGAQLSLWDPAGSEPVVMLSADNDGAALNLGVGNRVSLSASASTVTGPMLSLHDGSEDKSSSMHAASLTLEQKQNVISLTADGSPNVALHSGDLGGISFGKDEERFSFELFNCQAKPKRLASGKEVTLCDPTPQMKFSISPQGPAIEMDDRDGFATHIGRAELIAPHTGKRSVTSAASLILFDNKKNVLWSAP